MKIANITNSPAILMKNIPGGLIFISIASVIAGIVLSVELSISVLSGKSQAFQIDLSGLAILLLLCEIAVAFFIPVGLILKIKKSRFLVLLYIVIYGLVFTFSSKGFERYFALILMIPIYMLAKYLYSNKSIVSYFSKEV